MVSEEAVVNEVDDFETAKLSMEIKQLKEEIDLKEKQIGNRIHLLKQLNKEEGEKIIVVPTRVIGEDKL